MKITIRRVCVLTLMIDVGVKIAGWNIMRASVCAKMREIVWERAMKAVFSLNFAFSKVTIAVESASIDVCGHFLSHRRELEKYSKLSIVA